MCGLRMYFLRLMRRDVHQTIAVEIKPVVTPFGITKWGLT